MTDGFLGSRLERINLHSWLSTGAGSPGGRCGGIQAGGARAGEARFRRS